MKNQRKSYGCPKCKIKFQMWIELDGPHETFNSFAFTDYRNPISRVCTPCKLKEKKLV